MSHQSSDGDAWILWDSPVLPCQQPRHVVSQTQGISLLLREGVGEICTCLSVSRRRTRREESEGRALADKTHTHTQHTQIQRKWGKRGKEKRLGGWGGGARNKKKCRGRAAGKATDMVPGFKGSFDIQHFIKTPMFSTFSHTKADTFIQPASDSSDPILRIQASTSSFCTKGWAVPSLPVNTYKVLWCWCPIRQPQIWHVGMRRHQDGWVGVELGNAFVWRPLVQPLDACGVLVGNMPAPHNPR
jgi:hypothetical protein